MSKARKKLRKSARKKSARRTKPTTVKVQSMASFLTYAPLLIILLSFYTLGLIRGEDFPPYAYLFMGLILTASGVLGLRPTALAVLGTIVLGQLAGFLVGYVQAVDAAAGAVGLVLAATAIPLIAKTKILVLSTSHKQLSREQLEVRLNVGERLAKGTTPNPVSSAVQPTSSTEALVRNLLLPAKKALRCRTAMFFWHNETDDVLVPVETLSDCPEMLSNTSISIQEGKLAALKKSREPITFRFDPNSLHYIPLYRKKVRVTGVMAVPCYHNGTLAAALVFDRDGADPFFLPENVIAKRLADSLEASLVTERRLKSAVLLSQQLRMMDEAARQFSTARTFEQVYDTVVRYAVGFAPFNTAVLAHRVNSASEEFEVVGVNRKPMAGLLGKQFKVKGTLCELAAKSRTHLPPNFTFEERMAQPFGPDFGLELEEDEAVVLLPLMIRDEAVGFLLMADSRKRIVKDDLVSLFLFAEYCAVSLVNAEANKELERMATSDPLTAIPNHRAFRTRIVEAVQRAERSKKSLSLLFIDIDHFKSVNDTFGHATGDAVLKTVARTLDESVRKVDFVARYGGEEFVAVLEETAGQGALIMGERLRQRVARLDFDEMDGKGVTISVGISSFPEDTKGVEELIALADSALYRAKNEGRDQCQVA